MSDRVPLTTRLAYRSLRLLGRLPLVSLQRLGGALARVYAVLRLREWRVARRNLELCFPDIDPHAREALLRDALRASAATFFEWSRLWTRDTLENLALVRAAHGVEKLDAAVAAGRGVIVAAPHLGNWELLSQFIAARVPMAIVYRPPRLASMDALLRRCRATPNITQVRAEASAVRVLLRTLQAGGVLGILPDQQPKRGEGTFAPFFGIQAFTMTLLPRLAQRTGARVVFAWAERLPHGRGFDIHFHDAPDGIADADPARAAAALNRGVEACARRAPAQYQWTYKRFSMRPPGEPRRYP